MYAHIRDLIFPQPNNNLNIERVSLTFAYVCKDIDIS